MAIKIETLRALDPHAGKLRSLAIDTFEQLQSTALAASSELSAYLGTDLDALLATVPAGLEAIPAAALDAMSNAHYALGVNLDGISPMTTVPAYPEIPAAAGSGCRNLVSQMSPIRDQGGRGTCVAHAALAAYEQYLRAAGASHDLSEQFLYWNCKANDGLPAPGTWLGVAMPLLKRDGCCPEANWNYVSTNIPGSEGQGPPPPGAQVAALTFRPAGFRTIAPAAVADYKAELTAGRSVAFSIPVFNSWYGSASVKYTGDITMPLPGEVRIGGHAMCIVGCIDQPERPEIGGGRFILRNSWGRAWGIVSPHGVGYGTIPYAYIARFGQEAYSIG